MQTNLPKDGNSVPAFIANLWHMVSDKSCDSLISWTPGGRSFFITDQARFCTELLPRYYKHNNLASFIRQLNKYGFHKVLCTTTSLDNVKRDLEFAHKYFVKGHPAKLAEIKRKLTANTREVSQNGSVYLPMLIHQVHDLQERHKTVENQMAKMKRENDALWREHSLLRQKHDKQSKIVNQLIQFIITLIQQTRNVNLNRMPVHLLKDMNPTTTLRAIESRRPSSSPAIREIIPTENDSLLPDNIMITSDIDESVISPSANYTISSPVENSIPSEAGSELSLDPSEPGIDLGVPDAAKPPSPLFTIELVEPPSPDASSSLAVPLQEISPAIVTNPISVVQPIPFSGKMKANAGAKGKIKGLKRKNKKEESNNLQSILSESFGESSALPSTSKKWESQEPSLSDVLPEGADSSLVVSDGSPQFNSKFDLDTQLESVQTDIDSLKDILQGLDTSAFYGLFSSDDPLGLKMSDLTSSLDPSASGTGENQQLVSFNPSLIDILNEEEDDLLAAGDSPVHIDSIDNYVELNTPKPLNEYSPSPKRFKK